MGKSRKPTSMARPLLVSLPQLLPRTKSLEAPSPSRLMALAVALGLLQLLIRTKRKIKIRRSQRKRRRRTTQMATPTMKETTIFSEDLQLLLHSVILIHKSNLSQIEINKQFILIASK